MLATNCLCIRRAPQIHDSLLSASVVVICVCGGNASCKGSAKRSDGRGGVGIQATSINFRVGLIIFDMEFPMT